MLAKGASQRAGAMRPSSVAAPRPATARSVVAPRRPVVCAAVAAKVDWAAEAKDLDSKSPLEAMDHALAHFGDEIGIAFSGAEDVALIEYAKLTGRPFRVFSLDTGRLNPETYRVFDAVEKHYGIHIEYTFPDAKECMDLVRTKGLFSFYNDGHNECCKVRKVLPLRRQLKTLKAWITGQRKDQSPGTRMAVPIVQVDPAFEGVEGGPGSLIKYNPLSNATSAEVWNFLRVQGVPVNELHAQGYDSIGCEPCTRPVLPNQHEREGRWWWEDATAKECGLHSGNIKKADGTTEARVAERDLWADGPVVNLTKEQAHALASGKHTESTLLVLYAPWCPFCQAMEASYTDLAAQMKGTSIKVAKYHADIDKEFCTEKLGLKTFPTIIFLPKGREGFIKYPSERRDAETLKLWVKAFAGAV